MDNLLKNLAQYLHTAPFLAYVAVFIGGIISSLEPCIYTMIPITVGFIGRYSQGSKLKSFILSIIYVLGIAVTYSALGAIAALTGSFFGEISSNPIVYFILGNVCLILGLSMFDVWTIKLPSFISNIQPRVIGKGFISIFLLGVLSGFVAGPCTAAIVGVILAFVATKQNLVFGVSLLFTYSIGMGILLIIIGTFTGVLMSLPKAGQWMNKIRKGMGWFLLAIAQYMFYIMGKMSV